MAPPYTRRVSFQRGMDDNEPLRPESAGSQGGHEEIRPARRSDTVATGSLACPACDVPVTLGGRAMAPRDLTGCPYCHHVAPLRDFLSLTQPTRPTRVIVRLSEPLRVNR